MNQVASGLRAAARAARAAGTAAAGFAQELGRAVQEGWREGTEARRQQQASGQGAESGHDYWSTNSSYEPPPATASRPGAAPADAAELPNVGDPIVMRAGFTPVDVSVRCSSDQYAAVIANMRANGLTDEQLLQFSGDITAMRQHGHGDSLLLQAYQHKYAGLIDSSFVEHSGNLARLSLAIRKTLNQQD